MGDSDEFDDGNNAPLPPHERPWRHPAEVSDENRRRHMFESAPPPVGRRITALVAFVSLVASGAILSVTISEGMDDRPAADPAADGPAPTVPAKGATGNSVVAVTPHVVATAGPVVPEVRLADGRVVKARHLRTVTGHRLTLLSTDSDLVSLPHNDLTDEEFRYLASEGQLSLEEPGGTTSPVRLGLRTEDTGKWWPFETDSVFGSVARLLDNEGNLVGVAVRDRNSTWAMKLGDLVAMISAPDGDAQGG